MPAEPIRCTRCNRILAKPPENKYICLCDGCRFILDNMAVSCNEP